MKWRHLGWAFALALALPAFAQTGGPTPSGQAAPSSVEAINERWQIDATFEPEPDRTFTDLGYATWLTAVERSRASLSIAPISSRSSWSIWRGQLPGDMSGLRGYHSSVR